jgi:hypothetical protein
VGRAGAVIRPAPSFRGFGFALRVYALAGCSALAMAFLVVAGSGPFVRLLCALAVAAFLISLSLANASAGVAATFVYLVLVAFLRRLLIPAAGWISADPMLLVAPVVAGVLLVKLFVLERRPLAPDLLSRLVLLLLALTLLEAFNPAGGIGAGITGLLFMAVPLLWLFVGREVLTDRLSDRMMVLVIVLGTAVGAYGLVQTQLGDPPWDVNWLNVTGGYDALNVGGQIRAWGTFSSSAEYALFVGSALAAAVAFVLRGRAVAMLVIPVLAVSLFLSSGRGALITAFLAIVVMLGLRTRRPVMAVIVTVCAVGLAFGALKVFGSTLSSTSASSGSELISHQLGGIADPLNPNSSTLLLHWKLVEDGVKSGITHPLGKGTGATNNAAGVNQQSALEQTQATEVDMSNAFVALGAAGGVLYVLIVLAVLWKAAAQYFARREAMLPVIGLLVVGLGQWLTGGHYALSPLTWLLIGVVAAGSAGSRLQGRSGDLG